MKVATIGLFFAFFSTAIFGQKDCFPPKDPKRLVYDLTQTLSNEESVALENNLDTFALQTSNQIVVIITQDLCGWEPSEYCFRLMDQWGVGQADLDNGIVILVKPKTAESKGQAFIATGRGLEGALPDGKVHLIWEKEMIPAFKANHYYQGIQQAVSVIESIARKEYDFDTYAKKQKKNDGGAWMGLLIFGGVFLWMMLARGRQAARTNGLPFWSAFWLMNSGPRRGYWNDFNGGNNHWGGGGGFGGFGGGSSGGGGAGGSW